MTWTYLAADLLTGEILDELPLRDTQFEPDTINRAGDFSALLGRRIRHVIRHRIPYHRSVTDQSPTVYWRLGETSGTDADDFTGNGNTGTYTGTPLQGVDGLLAGDVNRGVELDGASHVSGPDLSLAETTAWSYEVLVQGEDLGAGAVALGEGSSGSATPRALLRASADPAGSRTAELIVVDDAGTSVTVTGTTVIEDGQAHHLLAERDGDTLRLYIDGNEEADGDASVLGTITLDTFAAGAHEGPATGDFATGTLDEAAAYPAAIGATRAAVHAASFAGDLEEATEVTRLVSSRTIIEPGNTIVWVLKGDLPVFGAIIWDATSDDGADDINLTGAGVWSFFHAHRFRAQQDWSAGRDVALVLKDALDYVQGIADKDLGVDTSGLVAVGRSVALTVEAFERRVVGDFIESLADADDGFDFRIDVGGAADAPTLTARVGSGGGARIGRKTDLIVDDSNVVGRPGQTLGIRHRTIDVLGAGFDDDMLIGRALDTTLAGSYPNYDHVASRKDERSQDVLNAIARAERAKRIGDPAIPTPTLRSTDDFGFGDFVAGDEVTVRYDDGFVAIDGRFRIDSYTVIPTGESELIRPVFIEPERYPA